MANTGLNTFLDDQALIGGNAVAADGTISLDDAISRINIGLAAGNTYIKDLETIVAAVDVAGGNTTMGNMIKAQLQMTEAETAYTVRSSIPKKASSTNQQAAGEVKKAAG
jgi:hypothetical protein